MRGMTLEKLAAACGGDLHCGDSLRSAEITSVTADSRQAHEGCLFVAIRGERSDGHDYIPDVVQKGALCVLCERAPDTDCAYILVSSSTAALQAAAAYYRSQFDCPFIGITGSVGKTTVKEMIAAVLGRKYRVYKTEKNNNSQFGVPQTLFGMSEDAEVAVIEMGVSMFGEMQRLTRMVRPDMAVFTIIGEAHLEFLSDREGVLRAKSEMLECVPDDGVVFVNGDDDLLSVMNCRQRVVSFGLDPACSVYARDVRAEEGCMCFDVCSDGRSFPVRVPAYGAHMVTAALAAAAVAMHLGLTDDQIAEGIADFRSVGSRDRIVSTGRITVLDDCYNSNPTSAASSIASLSMQAGRRVCILGDMRELGEKSRELHYQTGLLAAQSGAQLILACGPESETLWRGAKDGGAAAWYFPEVGELLVTLSSLIRDGDAVLVKASRGMHFETVTEALLGLFSD